MDATEIPAPAGAKTDSQTREVEQLLFQVRVELFALWAAYENGYITIHVGKNHGVVEVNRTLADVKREPQATTPKPKRW